MIRVLVADDDPMVRLGIRTIIDHEQDLQVVGEAEDGEDALRLVQELEPDLVLMDIRMPIRDGLDATKEITRLGHSAEEPHYAAAPTASRAGHDVETAAFHKDISRPRARGGLAVFNPGTVAMIVLGAALLVIGGSNFVSGAGGILLALGAGATLKNITGKKGFSPLILGVALVVLGLTLDAGAFWTVTFWVSGAAITAAGIARLSGRRPGC